FDIDCQGAAQLAAALPRDVVRVFILPPSISALEARLRARAQDSDDVVARRMARARDEISHWDQYDYVIVNHDVAASLDQLKAVVAAEQQRRDRQTGLAAFVDDLA
ncbi:MAG: guanylate kinase, partial [Planctomycetota bacterium]